MRILAAFSTALSVAVFLANYLLPVNALLPIAVFCAVLAVGLLLPKRRWLRGAVLAFMGFSVGLGVFLMKYSSAVKPCRDLDGQTLEISGTVISYPQVYDDYCSVTVRLTGDNTPHVQAIVYDSSMKLAEAIPGQILSAKAKLSSADMRFGKESDKYNSRDIFLRANLKSEPTIRAEGFRLSALPALFSKAVSDRVDKLFSPEIAAFLRSLMLGDKSELVKHTEIYNDLSDAGILHVAAVSGMHVAFLVGLILSIFGAGRNSAILSIILVWLFVFVTGSSPSAVRAGFMQSLLLLAPVVRRENDPVTSLSFVLALVLIKNPYAAASVSLQLSFGAMAGILCFSNKIYDTLTDNISKKAKRLLKYPMAALASSISVMVFTIPLSALHFGVVSVLAPIANLLTLWAVSFCFCGGYICTLLSVFSGFLGKAAAWIITLLVKYIFLVVRAVSSVSFVTVYLTDYAMTLWIITSLAMLLIIGTSRFGTKAKLLLSLALSFSLLFSVHYSTDKSYRSDLCDFAVIDVGQGQCIAAFTGDTTVVVDCGGGGKNDNAGEICTAYLKSRGRTTVDALLLTHLHSDHTNGVVQLMENVEIKQLILGDGLPDSDGLLPEILESAERNGTEVETISCDTEEQFGDLKLFLYSPQEIGDANERCVMCRLSVFDYDMLVTGDAPISAEDALVKTHDLGGTEFFVVGHHGSKYSSGDALLESLGAKTAIISVGYNSYGHPTNETLARLTSYGYNILRTDVNGTVEIRVR